MGIIMIICLVTADPMMWFFTNNIHVHDIAVQAIRILSSGYVFYGIGMVLINAFNGAGDTKTPTWVNFFGFWTFQIPMAWLMAKYLAWGPTGVFWAIPIAEALMTVAAIILFRRGRWKRIEV